MVVDPKILLMIFLINISYVTLSTIRFMLTMKGYKKIAPLIAMVEVVIYVSGLGLVLSRLDNPLNLAVYAIGHGVGISVGIQIEEFLALGYIMVTAIVPNGNMEIAAKLRDLGYGVTVSHAEGREGERLVLEILSSRKTEKQLYQHIKQLEAKAFVISYEPKYISGGFWTKKVRN